MKVPARALTVSVLLAASTVFAAPAEAPPPPLAALRAQVQSTLDHMDRDLAATAATIGRNGLKSAAARKALRSVAEKYPSIYDAAAVDLPGKMVTIEPGDKKEFEGAYIGDQKQVIAVRRTRRPVLSRLFRAVEGFTAVDLHRPVLDPKGKLIGSASLLVRPQRLLATLAEAELAGFPLEAWAMQRDGQILFDPDTQEVGRSAVHDPLYQPFPEFRRAVALISGQREGSAVYSLPDQPGARATRHQAYWTTVGLHGTEWRLVVVKSLDASGEGHERPFSALDAARRKAALRAFAAQPALGRAMAKGDRAAVLSQLAAFYRKNPGFYSVQWIDEKAVTRFGYPKENSLSNYDFHTTRSADYRQFVEIVRSKREAALDLPLVEGGRGAFHFVPVFHGKRYLGLVYTLVRLPGAQSPQ